MLNLNKLLNFLLPWLGSAKVSAAAEVYVLVDGVYYGIDNVRLTSQVGHEDGKPAVVIEASPIIL